MTNPVVEAMARAYDPEAFTEGFHLGEEAQNQFQTNARAVARKQLQALKDNVSEEMLETLMKHCPLYADGTFSPSEAVSIGIGAMIDTAMKEETDE